MIILYAILYYCSLVWGFDKNDNIQIIFKRYNSEIQDAFLRYCSRLAGSLRKNRQCPLCTKGEVVDEILDVFICQFNKQGNMFRHMKLINKNF